MTLREQIGNGESAILEFKEARPKDALKFVKTVVAFANGRGGRILFGVEDGTAGYSKVRNRGLAEALVYMHEVENWGGGVARYYARCAQAGIPPPLVEERGGCLSVTFYRPSVANGVVNVVNVANGVVNHTAERSETVEAIVGLIRRDNRISAAKIALSLGMVNRTVQRILKALQTQGRLKRVGGTRGIWLVMEDRV